MTTREKLFAAAFIVAALIPGTVIGALLALILIFNFR